MKPLQQVINDMTVLLSNSRLKEQAKLDSNDNLNFDFNDNSIAAYQIGSCYTIQVIRQELLAGSLITDEIASVLDSIQYSLQ